MFVRVEYYFCLLELGYPSSRHFFFSYKGTPSESQILRGCQCTFKLILQEELRIILCCECVKVLSFLIGNILFLFMRSQKSCAKKLNHFYILSDL